MVKLLSVSNSLELSDDLKMIYIDSFPPDERREWQKLKELINHPNFEISQILYNKEAIGLIVIWNFSDFSFIEHFAIRESARGKGIGNEVLRQIIEEKATRVIVEVEEPTNVSACRRIAFYNRLGFSDYDGIYYQPAYSPDKKKVKMLIMSFPHKLLPNEFEEIKTKLYREVYQYTDSE